MPYKNSELSTILGDLDLGSSVAEEDEILKVAMVETSAFTDLLNDRVDLVPGTKGSGKSALFRFFVGFLPEKLLKERKVVVAHGVDHPGDPVFLAFKEEFEKLTEQDFISFWCVYLISLAHEQFIKGERYVKALEEAHSEIDAFKLACEKARIPEIQARKTLREILGWTLQAVKSWRPKITYKLPQEGGEVGIDLFGDKQKTGDGKESQRADDSLPEYVTRIKDALEKVLVKAHLSLWLMIDRLDEIFPRRSEVEKRALRGLLRAMQLFSSKAIRVKVFFRDDMLDQVVRDVEGFTALTHVTARQADTLRWTEEQILSMVVKRIIANEKVVEFLSIDKDRVAASSEYRSQVFYMVFPPTVHRGPKQSTTLRWLYTRCSDGRGVVTPRDVIDLLTRAKQQQYQGCVANVEGSSEWIMGPQALQYGLEALSKKKRQTYLEAEFPHLWRSIEKFVGGKTEYDERAMKNLLGERWKELAEDLVSIGVLSKKPSTNGTIYSIPFVYRIGLNLTQGKAEIGVE